MSKGTESRVLKDGLYRLELLRWVRGGRASLVNPRTERTLCDDVEAKIASIDGSELIDHKGGWWSGIPDINSLPVFTWWAGLYGVVAWAILLDLAPQKL